MIDFRYAVVLAALAAPASALASAHDVFVENDAGVSPAYMSAVEAAVQAQVNGPVQAAYPGAETVNFVSAPTTTSWTVRLVLPAQWLTQSLPCPAVDLGCHWYGDPVLINVDWIDSTWGSYIFSHELVESAVDPAGGRPEVCDPVNDQVSYAGNGVYLADFVRPDGSVWSVAPAPASSPPRKHPRKHPRRRPWHRRLRRRSAKPGPGH